VTYSQLKLPEVTLITS